MPHSFSGRACLVFAAALGLASCSNGAGSAPPRGPDAAAERAEVEAWRAQHEASYRKEYVVLGGLFFLHPGGNTAGSDASNSIVLPARAPARIGQFVLHGDAVRFEPSPRSGVTLHGRPVTAPVDLTDDASGDPDEVTLGDLAMWVHLSGERRTVRLRDPQGAEARSFAGFTWFPIDPAYRVVGRFIRDETPTSLRIPNMTGDYDNYTSEGAVEFTLNGQTRRLRPMTTGPNEFFFIFRDGTSGKETYAAARFLYSQLEDDGTMVLDFNEAYNPPCAFNSYTTCPIPPPENRLDIRIPAGERAYVGAHTE
jgi:uncharacterized protein